LQAVALKIFQLVISLPQLPLLKLHPNPKLSEDYSQLVLNILHQFECGCTKHPQCSFLQDLGVVRWPVAANTFRCADQAM
jgi:hypothetical protein